MGEVLLAEHEGLQRPVALKRFVFSGSEGDDEETAKERFYREGRALARLNHHNIVGVYDLFEWRKNIYLAVEYVDGPDLSQLLGDQPCPVEVACLIALGAARGLEAAHKTGIIHRDVKASNVMVTRRGEVKLMDFGIARQDVLEPMTRTGIVVGTPRYLAPEVINGEVADARSDVYGVGTILYLALSGQRIFDDAKQENLFYLIAAGKYRPVDARHAPRELRRIVRRCLERDPARRFGSAAALSRALEAFIANQRLDQDERLAVATFVQAREAAAHAPPDDLSNVPATDAVQRPATRRSPVNKWALVGVLGAAALAVIDAFWFGYLAEAVEAVPAWLQATAGSR